MRTINSVLLIQALKAKQPAVKWGIRVRRIFTDHWLAIDYVSEHSARAEAARLNRITDSQNVNYRAEVMP